MSSLIKLVDIVDGAKQREHIHLLLIIFGQNLDDAAAFAAATAA